MISSIQENQKLYLPVVLSVVLLLAAFLHSLMIDDLELYRKLVFIIVEMVLMIGSFIGLLVLVISSIRYLATKRWEELLHSTVSFFIALALIAAAMKVDAPTLVYMT